MQKVQISEANLSKENERLRQTIQSLAGLLAQSGGHVPEDIYIDEYRAEEPYPEPGTLYDSCNYDGFDVASIQQPNSLVNLQPEKSAALVKHHSNEHKLCEVDLTTAGMDFVLTYVFHFTKR